MINDWEGTRIAYLKAYRKRLRLTAQITASERREGRGGYLIYFKYTFIYCVWYIFNIPLSIAFDLFEIYLEEEQLAWKSITNQSIPVYLTVFLENLYWSPSDVSVADSRETAFLFTDLRWKLFSEDIWSFWVSLPGTAFLVHPFSLAPFEVRIMNMEWKHKSTGQVFFLSPDKTLEGWSFPKLIKSKLWGKNGDTIKE